MAENKRRLAIAKRISLKGVAEGWSDDCYVLIQPLTYGENKELKNTNTDGLDDEKATEIMIGVIKRNFVSGKVMLYNDNGEAELSDAEADDIENLPATALFNIFADITGASIDPKDIPEVQPEKKEQTNA